jgi:hypothetical protein
MTRSSGVGPWPALFPSHSERSACGRHSPMGPCRLNRAGHAQAVEKRAVPGFSLLLRGSACSGVVRVAALGVGALISCCSAEDIRIRLVNAQTGEPEKGLQSIGLYPGRDQSGFLRETTDMNGIAVFRLPSPLVEWVTASESSRTLYQCSPYQKNTFKTAEILRRGVIALNVCDAKGKLKGEVEAKPGEVIVFPRPLHWWEKAQW